MPILDNLVYAHLRLQVVSAASQRIVENKPGIHCVGFPAAQGQPALVVVWDEDVVNEGASATNSIESVLLYLRQKWAGVIPVEQALVVERDSAGDFDHAYPEWDSPRGAMLRRNPTIGWLPLRWPDVKPRSLAAFEAMFGPRATAVLDIVRNASK
jgi:hypothetical protein